jgi:hypothetical protein
VSALWPGNPRAVVLRSHEEIAAESEAAAAASAQLPVSSRAVMAVSVFEWSGGRSPENKDGPEEFLTQEGPKES